MENLIRLDNGRLDKIVYNHLIICYAYHYVILSYCLIIFIMYIFIILLSTITDDYEDVVDWQGGAQSRHYVACAWCIVVVVDVVADVVVDADVVVVDVVVFVDVCFDVDYCFYFCLY